MAAKYRKIDPRIWGDEKFELLSTAEKLVAFNCLTGQSNRVGIFKMSLGMGAEQCGMASDSYAKAIVKVCDTLNWTLDRERNVLYIPTWFKYNPPENPKHFAGCLADLHDLPQTPILQAFLDNVADVPVHCLSVLNDVRDSYAKAMPYQKQEQEQKNTPIAPKGAAPVAAKQAEPQPDVSAEMRTADDAAPKGFAEFWAAWPPHERKVGKAQALRIWKRRKLESIAGQVIAALGRCKATAGWTKRGGEFIPGPVPWLNKTPWLTDPDDLPSNGAEGDPDAFIAVRPSADELDALLGKAKGGAE